MLEASSAETSVSQDNILTNDDVATRCRYGVHFSRLSWKLQGFGAFCTEHLSSDHNMVQSQKLQVQTVALNCTACRAITG